MHSQDSAAISNYIRGLCGLISSPKKFFLRPQQIVTAVFSLSLSLLPFTRPSGFPHVCVSLCRKRERETLWCRTVRSWRNPPSSFLPPDAPPPNERALPRHWRGKLPITHILMPPRRLPRNRRQRAEAPTRDSGMCVRTEPASAVQACAPSGQ